MDEMKVLQDRLAIAEMKVQEYELSNFQTRSESEEQKTIVYELQNRLADAEFKLIEGERLRKKLHNTILELKGNIRVFCRVRPLIPEDGSSEAKHISYPTSLETLGRRGIDLTQNGNKQELIVSK